MAKVCRSQTLKKCNKEIERFYSDLCKSDTLSPSENMLNSFLKNPDVPKLSQVDAQVCEGKLTVSECFKSLQLFQNNKSPGNDGLTVEFYKAFWHVLGEFMVNSLRWPNTVCARFTDSVSDAIKRALGLW